MVAIGSLAKVLTGQLAQARPSSQSQLEGFVVTGPLAPNASRLTERPARFLPQVRSTAGLGLTASGTA